MKKFIVVPLLGILSLAFVNFNTTDKLLVEKFKSDQKIAATTENRSQELCYFGVGSWSDTKHVTSKVSDGSASTLVSAKTKGTDCTCKESADVILDPTTPTPTQEGISFLVTKYGV